MPTRLADVIVPEIFAPYVQQLTEEKSRLIQSGAVYVDARLNSVLTGGGVTFNEPSFRDLETVDENISTDDPATQSAPNKIGTSQEVQIRLSRNNSWSSMDLAADLAGADPMQAIANRVADYWTRRHQKAFTSTIQGVFAWNAAAASPITNDMTFDVSGTAFVDGVTNFSAEAFIDATSTMGDSMDDLGLVMMHSVVYARALKNNLIDFISDSTNPNATRVPTFLGRTVIVDDGMPMSGGVFNTWLFANGSVRVGSGQAKVPAEVARLPDSGNGGGSEVLYNRVEWIIHPTGCAFTGPTAAGDVTNAVLAAATSWTRAFPERKQVKIARLVTREF